MSNVFSILVSIARSFQEPRAPITERDVSPPEAKAPPTLKEMNCE